MFCVNCGKEVRESDNFCGNCGKRLVGENEAAASAQSAAYTLDNGIRVISTEEPIFRVKCEYCRCEFEYRLGNLGYRAWYPSGFVYCPKCNKPLRHRLEYEVK